jgi:hypothetical protein
MCRPRPYGGRHGRWRPNRSRWDCPNARQRKPAKSGAFATSRSLLSSPCTGALPRNRGPLRAQPWGSLQRQTRRWRKADSNRWSRRLGGSSLGAQQRGRRVQGRILLIPPESDDGRRRKRRAFSEQSTLAPIPDFARTVIVDNAATGAASPGANISASTAATAAGTKPGSKIPTPCTGRATK